MSLDRTNFGDLASMPRFEGQTPAPGFQAYFDQLDVGKELWNDVYSWPWVDPSGTGSLKGFQQCMTQEVDTAMSRSESITSSSDPHYSDSAHPHSPGSPASDVVVVAESRKRRRQEQNRAAQRALRERKEKTLVELQERVAVLNSEASTLREDNQQLKDALNEARKEVATLKSLLSVPSISAGDTIQERQTLNVSLGKASKSLILKINVDGQMCECVSQDSAPMTPVSLS